MEREHPLTLVFAHAKASFVQKVKAVGALDGQKPDADEDGSSIRENNVRDDVHGVDRDVQGVCHGAAFPHADVQGWSNMHPSVRSLLPMGK
jgi:hypothetical protein